MSTGHVLTDKHVDERLEEKATSTPPRSTYDEVEHVGASAAIACVASGPHRSMTSADLLRALHPCRRVCRLPHVDGYLRRELAVHRRASSEPVAPLTLLSLLSS